MGCRPDRWCWPGMIRSQNARAPTSSARHVIAMGCAPPTALPRIGGGTQGASSRGWSRCRSRFGPGPSRGWSPSTAAQKGLKPRGRVLKRRHSWPGSSGHAWGAGFQRATASWWGRAATAPARPPGFVAKTAVLAHRSARLMGTPRCLSRPHRARPARWDARVCKGSNVPPRERSWPPPPREPTGPWQGLGEAPEPSRSSRAQGPGPASEKPWLRSGGAMCMMVPAHSVTRMS
jgi:hypothetical protein